MPAEGSRAGVRAGARIALFDSGTLVGQEVRALLQSRVFPATDVRLYDARKPGAIDGFDDEALLVSVPDEEAILDLDIAFLCGPSDSTAGYLDWPARRGFVAIDMSGASLGRPGVPLVHTEINAGDIAPGPSRETRRPANLIGSPHPVAHNLASIASLIPARNRPVGADVTALLPASELGKAGIDELHQQTVGLLNFTSVPQEVFGRQLAFNVLASGGSGVPLRSTDERIAGEAARLLRLDPERVRCCSALVPVFHGHVSHVTLELRGEPDLDGIREAISASRDVSLAEDDHRFSPVGVADVEGVTVHGLRQDPGRPGRVSFWCVCDNLKWGATLNAVRIAERVADLLKDAKE